MTNPNTKSVSVFTVNCNGEIPVDNLVSFTVDMDLGQPDMCSLVLRNGGNEYSNSINLTDTVTVAVKGGATVFTGEVVGVEPVYRNNGENTVAIRGFNQMHRLLRGTKTRTYVQVTDADIVNRVATESNLSAQCGDRATQVVHDHVFQHSQNDLNFLRSRAARLGYQVWVTDRTLYFDVPRTDQSAALKLRYGDAEKVAREANTLFLKHFTPRMSSSNVVQQAEVRGWDPVTKQEIVGTATPPPTRLGSTTAHSATSGFGGQVTSHEVRSPVYSVSEANLLAESIVAAASMSYITGEGECRGTPDIKPGVVVEIILTTGQGSGGSERFNGNYVVTGATHIYLPAKASSGAGYVTRFRVSRDAEG